MTIPDLFPTLRDADGVHLRQGDLVETWYRGGPYRGHIDIFSAHTFTVRNGRHCPIRHPQQVRKVSV